MHLCSIRDGLKAISRFCFLGTVLHGMQMERLAWPFKWDIALIVFGLLIAWQHYITLLSLHFISSKEFPCFHRCDSLLLIRYNVLTFFYLLYIIGGKLWATNSTFSPPHTPPPHKKESTI